MGQRLSGKALKTRLCAERFVCAIVSRSLTVEDRITPENSFWYLGLIPPMQDRSEQFKMLSVLEAEDH
eukprot:4543996-Amphidinium_carterae.1